MRMTRRLRTDRMLQRVREVRATELLRAAGEDVRAEIRRDGHTIGLVTFPADELSAEQIAELQARWDETMRDQERRPRYIVLPGRTVIRPARPRKSTPRGLPRMREHARSLLLGALRGDGTPRSAARIAICRAYRVLPAEIGLTNQPETNGANDG